MVSLKFLFPSLLFGLALGVPVADTANSPQFAATTTWTFTGNSLPTGLSVDTGTVSGGSKKLLNHKFTKNNVFVRDGFLNLLVPGGQQGKKTITSAEVATTFSTLYGSVSTWAILTEPAGVCNGMFFYRTDSDESDIEFISDPTSLSNVNSPNGTRAMQYTNQALDGNPDDATMFYGALPKDATSTVHEYRLDWTASSTKFYVDGVLQGTLTKNVPNEAAYWLINNWVNGDKYWTKGPPVTDAYFRVQKIVMAYNPA